MKAKQILWISALVGACYCFISRSAMALPPQEPLVRLAELEIDPTQLEAYKAALKEEIAASIRIEPGVLKLYAVSVKDHPNQIRLFEMYRDQASYQAHLSTPHFKRYKQATQHMIKSLTLIETEPVLLGSR
jgi:quinol monooxygenase YgiN